MTEGPLCPYHSSGRASTVALAAELAGYFFLVGLLFIQGNLSRDIWAISLSLNCEWHEAPDIGSPHTRQLYCFLLRSPAAASALHFRHSVVRETSGCSYAGASSSSDSVCDCAADTVYRTVKQ